MDIDAKKSRVILISPPFERRPTSGITPPLGLCYISSYLRQYDIESTIIDLSIENHGFCFEDIPDIIKARLQDKELEYAKLIGIGPLMTTNLGASHNLIKILRKESPYSHITIGGPLCVAEGFEKVAANFLHVDSFVVGEGEIPMFELFKTLMNGFPIENSAIKGLGMPNKQMPKPCRLSSINILTPPARDLIQNELYFLSSRRRINNKKSTTAILSKGCPYDCQFCAASVINGKKVRRFSKKKIIEELNSCASLGLFNIVFYDDCFFNYSENLEESINKFISAIEISNWRGEYQLELRCDVVCKINDSTFTYLKNSGCKQINMGIEKGSNRCIKSLGKNFTIDQGRTAVEKLYENKIRSAGTFILGGPGEKIEDIDDTISYAISLPLDFAQFNPLTIIPGTQLYKSTYPNLKDGEWLRLLLNESMSPKGSLLWQNESISIEEIAQKISKGYHLFYTDERLKKTLIKLKNNPPDELNEIIKSYKYLKNIRGDYFLKSVIKPHVNP